MRKLAMGLFLVLFMLSCVQKENTIAIPQDEAREVLLFWKTFHQGIRVGLDEIPWEEFDTVIVGETHYGGYGQYEAAVQLIDRYNPSLVGLEIVSEYTKKGKLFVEGFNAGSISIKDATWQYYRPDAEPILKVLREKGIPISGIEPRERDSGWFNGGPVRFHGITDWAVRQAKEGERPLVYIGDGHTSAFALRRLEVLSGDSKEGWRYESQYLLKEHLQEAGFRPLVIHLASKTMLAQETDDLFIRLYQEFDGSRSRFLLELDRFYQNLVQRQEKESYFVKVEAGEYLYVFPDEKPFIAPPVSAWVSAQRYLEAEYSEKFAQQTLNRSTRTAGVLCYGIPGIGPHELICVSEDTGEVTTAVSQKHLK